LSNHESRLIVQELRKTYSRVESNIRENKDKIREEFIIRKNRYIIKEKLLVQNRSSQNPIIDVDGEVDRIIEESTLIQLEQNLISFDPMINIDFEVEKIIKSSASIQCKELAEMRFLETSVKKLKDPDALMSTFKKINWTWQKTKEWLSKHGLMIALSLIPVWAWFAAVWVAAKWASLALKWARLANYSKKAQFFWNAWKWIAFYQWNNLANNILTQDEISMKLLDWSLDHKEMIKASLFFNVLPIAKWFIPPWTKLISKETMAAMTAEVSSFVWIDVWLNVVYNKDMTADDFSRSFTKSVAISALGRFGWKTIVNSWKSAITNWVWNTSKGSLSNWVWNTTKSLITNFAWDTAWAIMSYWSSSGGGVKL